MVHSDFHSEIPDFVSVSLYKLHCNSILCSKCKFRLQTVNVTFIDWVEVHIFHMRILTEGGLAQLVAKLVRSMKLLYAGSG